MHLCLTLLEHAILLEHSINIISFFREKSNEYKLHDRININTPYFIDFCRGCCSISQRENQLHGKILLKTLILNNRVRLDKEFGSFYFTIVFFAQILWLLIFSIATELSLSSPAIILRIIPLAYFISSSLGRFVGNVFSISNTSILSPRSCNRAILEFS